MTGRLFERLRDRVVASDPAFSRLLLAVRVMLSLLLSAACLGGLYFITALPIASYGLALVISLTGPMMIRDSTSRGQLVSRAWAALAATLSVLLATLLAPWPFAADLMFLVVVFAAVYIRGFGMRWFGVGMISFMAYFMGDYLHPRLGEMGWVALTAVIAFAVTHLVTTVLLKDDPERNFRRGLVTIDRRIALILRELRDQAASGQDAVRDRRPMRRHIAQLRNAVLMAEGFIPQGEEGSLAAAGGAAELAVSLFDLQLAVERAAGASFACLPDVAAIEAVLRRDDAAIRLWTSRTHDDAEGPAGAARLLLRVQRARARLGEVLGPAPSAAFAAAPEIAAPAGGGGGGKGNEQGSGHGLVPKGLQLPIQVTVACGIALGCGLLVSPVRWYWAVITAFIVFNNTRSRADTVLRALQRSAGTFAGVVAGTIVATLAGGQMAVSGAGIFLLFFAGFYFVQVSYSVMIFCITVALALLYGLMGMFTPHLLVTRLVETVIGGLAGAGVAFFLFPSRASTAVEATLTAYLDSLEALLDAARQRACGKADKDDLLGLSRAVDRAYTGLAGAVRPMGGPWMVVTRFGAVRAKLLLLTGCAHWGRSLARGLSRDPPATAAAAGRIAAAVDEIKVRIAEARGRGAALFAREGHDGGDVPGRRPPLPLDEADDPAYALEVIAALMARAVT